MDIDIDLPDRDQLLKIIDHIPASIIEKNSVRKHNTGIYPHKIPQNPITKISSIDYNQAEQRGYFKIDILNVSIYKDIKNEAHLTQLMETEPLWDLLEQDEFTDLLFHLKGHGKILRTMKPKNIEQLAAVLAMIRPSKRHLIGKDWSQVFDEVWVKPENGEYHWKKSHSFAYAAAVIVQMNLICESISQEYS